MKLRTLWMLTGAFAVSACHYHDISADQTANDQNDATAVPLPANASESDICLNIDDESAAGKQAMEAVFTNTYATQLDAERLRTLNASGDYSHTGAEMLSGHCWTYAELTSDPRDPIPFHASWRCPIVMASNDPKQIGKVLVDDVDVDSCDFNVPLGIPTQKVVKTHLEHLGTP